MRILLLLLSINTSAFATPLPFTKAERDCLSYTVYIECRTDKLCTAQIQREIAKVILKRHKVWDRKETYHSRSRHICDIVKSWEFSGHKLMNKPKQDIIAFARIQKIISTLVRTDTSEYLFFRSDKSGQIHFK